LTLRY